MSNSKSNALTRNYSGKFGNQIVFRNRNGISIMAMPPRRRGAPPTVAQEEARKRFRLASRYAKSVLENPDMLAFYTARSTNSLTPYILAMTDHLRPPYVSAIDATGYDGTVGSMIRIAADDNFAVTEVDVIIQDDSGQLIEKGLCVQDQLTGLFVFTATAAVTNLSGVEIIATAHDHPGHTGNLSIIL